MPLITDTDIDLAGIPKTDLEEHLHPFGAGKFAVKQVMEPLPAAFLSQKRLDYDVRTDDNPVYVGFNVIGAATSDSGWVVQKLTYDSSSRVTVVQTAIGSWDSRASLTYS